MEVIQKLFKQIHYNTHFYKMVDKEKNMWYSKLV